MKAKDIPFSSVNPPWGYWRGLQGWNFYFLIKFALLWYGYLNFHPLANLVFLAFLVFPLPPLWLHRLRMWLALPIGIILLYYDTWLPSYKTIISQGANLALFSGDYLLALLQRFINWQMLAVGFVLLVFYLFISRWIRITPLVIAGMLWLNLLHIASPAISLRPSVKQEEGQISTQIVRENSKTESILSSNLPPTTANISNYLNQFFKNEKVRYTHFPALAADAQPFDILLISVCSLAWKDMVAAKVQNHPLWKKFDILLDNFNSAASYSNPAVIRLLRSSCGQSSHLDLFQSAPQNCYLFENLAKLGFSKQITLDHPGVFGDFLQDIREYGNLGSAPLTSQAGIPPELISYNNDPIENDGLLLSRWLKDREKSGNLRSITLYNAIPLHDGNRYQGQQKIAAYQPRAEQFFTTLDNFFVQLQQSGRKVLVILVPEHGANLTGDKLQMPGLRDIPSFDLTHVPVGVKLFGMKSPHVGDPLRVNDPTSYLAISELISRFIDGKQFNNTLIDWAALAKDLPQTAVVSENEGNLVVKYQGKFYLQLSGTGDWVPYPQ